MVNENIIEEAYKKAIEVLDVCASPYGFFASGGKEGYNAIWSRDNNITAFGSSLIKNEKFKIAFRNGLITLARNQSKLGQIPNAVDKFSKRKPHVDFQTLDSSLWYIIGHYVYKARYKDDSLFKEYEDSIKKAVLWLSYQDSQEEGLLEQLPTTDWQDAFPHKYGHVINTQALYYKVLNLIGEKKKAKTLKYLVEEKEDTKLWFGNYYLPYRWKNHRKYKEMGYWFDSLGNLLAIVFDLADRKKALKILSYIKEHKINLPYPVKTIDPPIREGDKDWQDYYKDCDAGKPYNYLNGGVWGFNGAFYILALIKYKKFKEAKEELKKLAEKNLDGNFPEWTHPITKKHYGSLQAWEAGMYILAYESFKKGKVLI